MAIQIDIQTTGVNTLERAAAAFKKISESAEGADAAFKGLSESEKKLISYFQAVAAATGATVSQLSRIKQTVEGVESSMSVFQRLGQPFTKLSSDLQYVVQNVILLEKELQATAALSSEKLGDAAYMGLVTQSKAAIELQKQLNVEIEKQGKLRAELAVLNGSAEVNPALRTEVETLKEASRQTDLLAAEKRKLLQVNAELSSSEERLANARAALKQGGYQAQINAEERIAKAREALAQGANQALINSEERLANARAALKQGGYQAQINAEERIANARIALAQGANQALINSEERLANARAALKQGGYQAQIAKETAAFETQSAALSKLGERLGALKQTGKLPTEQYTTLKKSLYDLNVELAKMGKIPTAGLATVSSHLRTLETSLANNTKTFSSWHKQAQYAIGGVARSFGAMTYSYAQLAPLLAGIAAGAAVKEVYQIGSAMEYALTYTNALDESMDKLSVEKMTELIQNMDGLRVGPAELAKGVLEFEKAGRHATEVLGEMNGDLGQLGEMAKFASLGEMDLAEAIKIVIGQSLAFKESYTSIANKITVAAASSATDIKTMANAFAYTTELATVSKVQFSELATAMAVMANRGIEGTKANTALRTSVLKLQNPTGDLKAMLDDLGLSWSAFTEQGQVKDLRTAFSSLKEAINGLPDPQRIAVLTELFGMRELKAGAALLDAMGAEWDGMYAKIDKAGEGVSEIQRLYEELSLTSEHLREVLKSTFEKQLSKAFDAEPVRKVLQDLISAVNSDTFVTVLSTFVDHLNKIGVAASLALKAVTALITGITKLGPNIFKTLGEITGGDDTAMGRFFLWVDERLEGAIAKAKEFASWLYGKVNEAVDWASSKMSSKTPSSYTAAQKAGIPFVGTSTELDYNLDAPTEEQLDALKKIEKQAEYTAKSIQRAMGEIQMDALKDSLPSYYQDLLKIREEAEKIEAKLSEKQGFVMTPEIKESIRDGLREAVDAKYFRQMQTEIDDLNFDNFLNNLKKSGETADLNAAKFIELQREAVQWADQYGQLKVNDDGNWEFLEKGQEYFEALLESQGIYLDKAKQMQAANASLNAELSQLSKAQFGPKINDDYVKKMGAYFNAFESGIRTDLPLLTEWDKKLIEIENKTAEFAENHVLDPQVNVEQIDAFRDKLIWLAEFEGLQKVEDQIQSLNFADMVASLEAAGAETDKYANSVNKVRASYLQLKEQAYQDLSSIGQAFKDLEGNITFGDAGARQFEAMVRSSKLFENAIVQAKKEVNNLKNSLKDMKFDFATDLAEVKAKGMSPEKAEKFKWEEDLKNIEKLKAEAAKAGYAGVEGRERQVELLQQAYSISQSMNTQTGSEEDTKKIQAQYDAMSEIQRQLTALKEAEVTAAQNAVVELQNEKASHEELFGAVQSGYANAVTVVAGYDGAVSASALGMATWSQSSVASIQEVVNAWINNGQVTLDNIRNSVDDLNNRKITLTADFNGRAVTTGIDALIKKFQALQAAAAGAAAAAAAAGGSVPSSSGGSSSGGYSDEESKSAVGSSTGYASNKNASGRGNVILNINQKLSRSDVIAITNEQLRRSAR